MPASTEPNFGIKHSWAVGESYKPEMDANLKKLGALFFCSVKNATTTAQPGSPAEGDRYIVGASATGAWSGKDKQVAVFANTAWLFYTPTKGWMARDESVAIGTAGCFKTFDGTNWVNADFGSPNCQPLDSDLTALANNSTNGMLTRTGSGTVAARTIIGTTDQITATNGDGVSGNPTLSFPTIIKPSRVQLQNGVFDNAKDAITKEYWEACGVPHIINGFGGMQNNTNFPAFTYDATDLLSGYGSFKETTITANSAPSVSQLLPIDPALSLKLQVSLKAGNTDGTEYSASNRAYIAVRFDDRDGVLIDPVYASRYPGATDTTLAADLVAGNTTVSLTNATGWYNSNGNWYWRNFVWWPYTNSFGYSYPNYSYSRNISHARISGAVGVGSWASGGISGNTITLTNPWTGATLPAGTPVRNNYAYGTYSYDLANNVVVPNSWATYSATYTGTRGAEELTTTKYFPGTAFIRFLFLFNYHGVGDTRYRVSAFSARYA